MPRYFTGRSVESKSLTLSTATTFQGLVTNLIENVVLLSVTRERYFKMSLEEQREAKKVGYFLAANFDGDNAVRDLADARDASLICLDIDAKEGDAPALPFVQHPALLRERLRWNFAAYKTISSTDEMPRMRVVVDARDIPIDRYADAVLTVAQAMGLPHVTPESKRPTQPMFRPSVFQGQNIDEDHPVIDTRFDGPFFTVDDISEDLDSLPGVVPGTRQTKVKVTGDAGEDFLTYFKLPVPQVTLEVAGAMLSMVDPDCSRPDWIDVGNALRHQFPNDEQAAYDLFRIWSERGQKFQGEDDTAVNWRAFNTQPRGRVPVTIRTLMKMAVEAGWDANPIRESCFNAVQDWLMFGCKSLTQLTSEGIRRIAATPLLSKIEEGMLLRTMMGQLNSKYEQKVGLAELKADLRTAKDAINLKRESPVEQDTLPWARGYFFVMRTKEFFRPVTHQKCDMIAFDAANSRFLLPDAEELKRNEQSVNQSTLFTPMFKPSLYVLNHAKCKTVEDYYYDPTQPEETVVHRNGCDYVNTYRRSYKAADKRQAAYAEDIFLDHLCNLVAEPELRTTILDWMAWQVQHPGEKVRWAILLQGCQGNGKTAIADVMCAVLGDENVNIINNNTIKQGWSEWGRGSQLVFMEEIRVLGADRHAVANSLKDPITNRRITVNRKGKDTETHVNMTNYMAFTNYHNAIPLEANDRRWCIIKSALQTSDQVAELTRRDPEYFDTLFNMCETHAAGLRHMLEERTITHKFKPNGRAPHTRYKDEMLHDTGNELATVVQQIITDGESPYVTAPLVAVRSMTAAMAAAGVQDVRDYQAFTLLREMGYTEAGRHLIGADKQPVWVRKDLIGDRNPLDLLGTIIKDATTLEDDWA